MTQLISQKEPKARKNYNCMASEFIRNCGNLRGLTFTFSEWRAIISARNNNWEVKKGEIYIRQYCEYEGRTYSFIAIPEIHKICIKYDYYEI